LQPDATRRRAGASQMRPGMIAAEQLLANRFFFLFIHFAVVPDRVVLKHLVDQFLALVFHQRPEFLEIRCRGHSSIDTKWGHRSSLGDKNALFFLAAAIDNSQSYML
jgi:hypothetical protein